VLPIGSTFFYFISWIDKVISKLSSVYKQLSIVARELFTGSNRAKSIVALLILAALATIRFCGSANFGYIFSKHFGYWICVFLISLVAIQLCTIYKYYKVRAAKYIAGDYKILLFSFVLGVTWMLHEPWVDRVLFDEYVYSGISYMMHTSREALNPYSAHLIEGRLEIFGSIPDKRGYLYSFLVSLLHDFTGYRSSNSYILNSFLGLTILPLTYVTSKYIFNRNIALIVTLLWFSFGLLPAHINSAGYDILNLFLLQIWLLLACMSVRSKSNQIWVLFFLTSICLALVRNESVFYLFGLLLIFIVRVNLLINTQITWKTVLSMVALTVPVIANINFSKLDGLRENVLGQDFFSILNLKDNFFTSLYFSLDTSNFRPNSPILALLGIVGLIAFLVNYVGSRLRNETLCNTTYVLLILACCQALSFILFTCNFWGNWNDPMVSRFSIPLHFGGLLMAAWLLDRIIIIYKFDRVFHILIIIAIVNILFTYPSKTNLIYTNSFKVGKEMEYAKSYLKNMANPNTLVITNGISGFISEKIPGIPVNALVERSWRIQAMIDQQIYSDILVFDRFVYDSISKSWHPDRMTNEPYELSWYNPDKFKFELLDEYFSSWASSMRVYRIISVTDIEGARRKIAEHSRANNLSETDKTLYILNVLP
jgi:hypothetical protein